ncbi:HpaII family restriction endonuclease [Mucilaginibacter puniceus]
MALSGNRGEWSEIYILLKLIADKEVFLGDKDLNKLSNASYTIISIIREGNNDETLYTLDTTVTVENKGQVIGQFSLSDFKSWSQKLLIELLKHKKGKFTYQPINDFLKDLNCKNLKANSKKKQDIILNIYDDRTHLTPSLGFSIKSQLGSPSTLVNASTHTNFTYEITGHVFNSLELAHINSISRYEDKLNYIQKAGGNLIFNKVDSPIFLNNLIMVDSYFPAIAAEITLSHYKGIARKLSVIATQLHSSNPLNYDTSMGHEFYHNKIKRFLSDYALGMVASKLWNGLHQANGGYLIVKKNGDVICYHFYYKNLFEEYLLNNTKTDTPDLKRITDSNKITAGIIYVDNGRQFIKLNLQIRFLV